MHEDIIRTDEYYVALCQNIFIKQRAESSEQRVEFYQTTSKALLITEKF